MAGFKTIADLDAALGGLAGRAILVRSDLNVPMADGRVTDATRIDATAPTIRHLAEAGARVVVMAHFGRPKGRDESQTLAGIAAPLAAAIGRAVGFASDCIGPATADQVASLAPGGVLLYATCSILRAEGEELVQTFMSETDDAVEMKIIANWGEACVVGRRIAPGGDFDGFYYARLVKRA